MDDDAITITVHSNGDDAITTAVDDNGDQVLMAASKIHLFPRGLRGIGGPDDRYTVPTIVAIGPYHHGQPHLQEMEKFKLVTLQHFCRESKCSVHDVYAKVFSVVGHARRCYADDYPVDSMGDAEFADIMLRDGCFLLQYLSADGATLQGFRHSSSRYSILKDMMLLENQIPWLVLDVLMEFRRVDVRGLVADVGDKFFPKKEDRGWCSWPQAKAEAAEESQSKGGVISYKSYEPAHLLDLLRFSQIWRMPADESIYENETGNSSLLSSSADELAQIGIKLTASTAAWLGDMRVTKGAVKGNVSLSPVSLNDVTACWLVNMAALEATGGGGGYGDDLVSSYLSALAMFMDKEEDVQLLRGQGVVVSRFSNTQTLEFFKRIGQHLHFGGRYFVVLEQIEAYKRNRPGRTFLNKLLYNSFKTMTIASLASIVGVLVGIFKTLLSNQKQH